MERKRQETLSTTNPNVQMG